MGHMNWYCKPVTCLYFFDLSQNIPARSNYGLFAACRKLLSGVVPLASLPRHEEIVEAVQLESIVVEGAFVESDWMESWTFPLPLPSSQASEKMASSAFADASKWTVELTGTSSWMVLAASTVLQRFRTFLETAKIKQAAPALFRTTGSHDLSSFSSLQRSWAGRGLTMSIHSFGLLQWLLRIRCSAIPAEKDATPASTPGCWALAPHSFMSAIADAVMGFPGILVKCERST